MKQRHRRVKASLTRGEWVSGRTVRPCSAGGFTRRQALPRAVLRGGGGGWRGGDEEDKVKKKVGLFIFYNFSTDYA